MAASKSHSGPHKHHGPKKHMFHNMCNKALRAEFSHITYDVPNKSGAKDINGNPLTHKVTVSMFNKYINKDAWLQSCMAHGQKKIPNINALWNEYIALDSNASKKVWLKELSKRDLYKEESDRRRKEATKSQFSKPIKQN